jgi:predicted Zn-dependent protease
MSPLTFRHLMLCWILALLIGISAIDLGCRSTPFTSRQQLILIPEQEEITLGIQGYHEVLQKEKISTNQEYTTLVKRVGNRISQVAGRNDYEWEFNVLASDTMNAFCLPGGKVAVYEGIIPICQNEAGLAVVMSHEVSHALARHGGERMSQTAVVNGVEKILETSTQSKDELTRQRIINVYGAATQYGFVLPYSRSHESEADHIGLLLMADAGYDPAEAPRFWQRFASMGGEKPPEFLSTHPSDQTRATDLEKLLPEANARYQKAAVKYGLGAEFVRK